MVHWFIQIEFSRRSGKSINGYIVYHGNAEKPQFPEDETSVFMRVLQFIFGGSDIHELRR